ncbi:MAG: glycoside hydrolase family 38 C-terminal domain-containing protein, partial [Microthrixaceae bacterium]
EDYLANAPSAGLPTHVGELRSGARANLLMGVASNRVDVKVAAARAERLLERTAEPLLSLWSPDPRRQQRLLDLAWLEVIRNAAHDSICACSHDEVVDAVLHRYAEASRTAMGLAERAELHAADRFAEPGLHLLNGGARARRQVVELDVPGPFDDDPVEHPALQVLEIRPARQELYRSGAAEAAIVVAREMLFEHPETRSVQLVDTVVDGARLLQVHLLPTTSPGEPTDGFDDPALSTSDALGEVGRRCADDPALVVSTVLHRAEPSRRALTLSPTVPGLGWARWEPTLPDHPVHAEGELGLTNGLVTVVVDPGDGTFSVDGVPGYGRLVDGGDAGDTYNWCPPEHDLIVDAPDAVAIERTETGPLRGRLVIETDHVLPQRAEEQADGTWRRAGEVRQPIRTTIELQADDGVVRVRHELVNRARDHRLRVHLPLPRRATGSTAECAFGVVRRPLFAEGGPNEWGVPTYPSRRFVQAGELSVTHEGLCEYELVDLDGDPEHADTTAGELALTLVRATGWLSRGPMASRPLPAGPEDRLEGAQVLTPLSLAYALCAGPATPAQGYALAEQVWSPLRLVHASHTVGSDGARSPGDTTARDVGTTGSWLDVRGAEVDAVLRDEDGALVVRVHEMDGRDGVLELPGRRGQLLDLRSRPLGPFDGTLALRPHQIVTIRLDPV